MDRARRSDYAWAFGAAALVAALVLALALAGCATPTAPARVAAGCAGESASVRVQATLGTIDGPALAGVVVTVDRRAAAVTGSDGRASIAVAACCELTIGVSHPTHAPYVPSATATLQPDAAELWRFAFMP